MFESKSGFVFLGAWTLFVLFSATVDARAQADDKPSRLNPAILSVDNSVSLSYVGSSVYYIEPDNGQIGSGFNDSEKGNIKGGRGAFSYMGSHGEFVQAQYTGQEGKLNYDGFLIGGPPYVPLNSTSRSTVQEFDAKAGVGFAVARSWVFTPYVTAGRRYWVRELGLGTSGGYNESYSFGYLGFGNLIQYSPQKRLVLSLDLSAAKMMDANINVPSAGLNHTVLGPGPVIRSGVEADYRLWRWLHGFVGLDYTYFNFWQSATQASGYLEPVSRTELYSASAGLRVSFKNLLP